MNLALSAAALALALQPSEPPPPPVVLVDFAQLPLEEATAPRCGVAFAIIQGAQEAGDERAKQWPDLAQANAREFFVRAMARLMDDRKLNKEQVATLVDRETQRLLSDNDKSAHEMMPPCLLMLKSSGR